MEGAISSFPASDPPVLHGRRRDLGRADRENADAEASPRFNAPFACQATEVTEKQSVSKQLATALDEVTCALDC